MQIHEVLFFLSNIIFHLTFLIVLLIITDLSRILGAALKTKPLYRLMYIACVCIVIAQVTHFTGVKFRMYAFGFDIAGLVLGCVVTYYYWKWLLKDLPRG
jgi:hypothetical protein